MKSLLKRLWREESGQDLTEYALLLVLLSLAAIGSLGGLATAINNAFNRAATNVTNGGGAIGGGGGGGGTPTS